MAALSPPVPSRFQALGARARDWSERPDVRANALRWGAVAALIALGLFWGAAVALAGPPAAIACVSALACVFILRDFRVGVVLMIVIMPISQSQVFPREMFGITGMNPFNLLMAATLFSFFFRAFGDGTWRRFVPRPVLWLYLVPLAIGAALGAQHINRIPGLFHDLEMINFTNAVGYIRDYLVRPFFFVLYALLLAKAVAKSEHPERFLTPLLISIAVMAGLVLVFIAMSGMSLSQLSGVYARHFLSALGLHANDLGRLYATGFALLLFVWDRTERPGLKLAMFLAMGAVFLALVLTFSRGAFMGFILVVGIYLLSRRKSKILLLAIPAIAVAIALVPGAVVDRLSMGFGSGLNAISAGRVDEIWAPIWPSVLATLPWGNGLGAIMWSGPMVHGALPPVAHPHNAYLQAWLDLGAIGFVLLLAFWIAMWRGFRSMQRDPRLSPEMQGLFEGAAAGLLAFLVAGLAGSSLQPVAEQVFLWLAVGMMFGLRARLARNNN